MYEDIERAGDQFRLHDNIHEELTAIEPAIKYL